MLFHSLDECGNGDIGAYLGPHQISVLCDVCCDFSCGDGAGIMMEEVVSLVS